MTIPESTQTSTMRTQRYPEGDPRNRRQWKPWYKRYWLIRGRRREDKIARYVVLIGTTLALLPLVYVIASPLNHAVAYLPIVVQPTTNPSQSATIPSQPTDTPSQPASEQVLALTNQLRQQNGCAPLVLSPTLNAAATNHSVDMAENNFLGHTGSDGSTLSTRLQEVGYDFTQAAENVAAGYATPEEVVNGWYNETPPNDGHRRNILNCDLKEIGIGQSYNATSTYRFYWTQDFGTH